MKNVFMICILAVALLFGGCSNETKDLDYTKIVLFQNVTIKQVHDAIIQDIVNYSNMVDIKDNDSLITFRNDVGEMLKENNYNMVIRLQEVSSGVSCTISTDNFGLRDIILNSWIETIKNKLAK